VLFRPRRKTIDRIAELLQSARTARALVIYLQNDGKPGAVDQPGSGGWTIHPEWTPLPDEKVLRKSRDDGFDGTGLESVLHEAGVPRLTVAGFCPRCA